MTHRTAAVRSEVRPIEWAVFKPEVSPEPLTREQYLAVLLSDGIASHRVAPGLIADLRSEYRDDEIVGLCMAAAIAHAGHVLNEAVRLSPKEGAACALPEATEGGHAGGDCLQKEGRAASSSQGRSEDVGAGIRDGWDVRGDGVEAPVRGLPVTKRARAIAPMRAGESGDAEIDAFLRDTQPGWLQAPELVAVFARVPEGLRGWRRLVEGIVEAVGAVVWELVAHRTAVVTGSAYTTSQPDESVGKRVEMLRPAATAPDIEAALLGRREYLAVTLADGVARHEVSAELFQELKDEYGPSELVALCMAASVAHVSHLVCEALGVGPDCADHVAAEKSRSR